MPENAFLSWYKILQDKILSAIDNLIATPINNLIFFLSMRHKDASPGPDAKHPYPSINNSRYALEYKELLLFSAILSVIGSVVVSFYKKLRDTESTSNYFFFERLCCLLGKDKDEDIIRLRTAAYFYNPDIPPIVLWIRQSWALLTGNLEYKSLEDYLKQNKKRQSKEKLLKEIFKEINQQLALFITEQKKYGEWDIEKKAGEWSIKPSADYLSAWQKQKKAQENINIPHFNDKKIKKTFFSSTFAFINSRLDELGRASFAYWIGVFIFYFLPGACVVTGIVWPPILVAVLFLAAIWATKIYASSCGNNKQFKVCVFDDTQKVTTEFLAAVKNQLLLDLLKQEKDNGALRYEKVKFKERTKKSKLYKEIRKVLDLKSLFRAVKAIFNGFILGCFIIFFSSWLLSSAALLLVGLFVVLSPATLSLVGVTVALATLGLGLVYGIYMAVQKYKEEVIALLDAETKLSKLQETCSDVEIPNISLRECDRLFRRGTIRPSGWTFTKQFFKRLWTGAIRLGTGVLFLKLLPLGTITALYAFYGIAVIPPFYPMLVIMLAGGLFFSACYIWQYHCESKEGQALRIMDFFLNRPYNTKSSRFSSPPTMIENNNKNNSQPRYRLSNELLNENERNFKNSFNTKSGASTPREQTVGWTGKIELSRRISSHPCLEQLNLASTQNSLSTTETYRDRATNFPQNFEAIKRKRSYSLPPTVLDVSRKIKQGIIQSDIEGLRLSTGSPILFRSSNQHSDFRSGPSQGRSPIVVH